MLPSENIHHQHLSPIQLKHQESLKEIGSWLNKYGETIYGTKKGPIPPNDRFVSTQKNNKVYIHLFDYKTKFLHLEDFSYEIKNIIGYENKKVLGFKKNRFGLTIDLSKLEMNKIDNVIQINLRKKKMAYGFKKITNGYFTQNKSNVTGSIGSVDVADAIKTSVTNVAEALQGRVAGVNVVSSGAPGAAPVVTIRGYSTTNSNNPLYVIDGVQTEDPNVLRDINPKDIDKISVLKGASASIYGSRGSNGVIVIKTK